MIWLDQYRNLAYSEKLFRKADNKTDRKWIISVTVKIQAKVTVKEKRIILFVGKPMIR